MPKIEMQKHTLKLRAGDYQRISEVYANRDLTAARVIRTLISRFVDNLEIKVAEVDEFKAIEGEL